MRLRQLMAASLAAVLAVGGSPILLAQQGALGGKATDVAKRPYTDYSVRVREPQSGQIVGTQTLTTDGQFSFSGLTLGQNYIVELIETANNNRVVCTEGPFNLNQGRPSMTNVNVDCGLNPASLALIALAAGGLTAGVVVAGGDDAPPPAGTPTVFGFTSQSNSR